MGTLQQDKVTERVPALHCREQRAMGRSHPAQGANSGQEREVCREQGLRGELSCMVWVSMLSCLADEQCALPAKPTSC